MLARVQRLLTTGWGIAAMALLLAAGLIAVGLADFTFTRRQFRALVTAQAASARDTIAAAARANRASATEAREQLAERLLDNARLLARLERSTPLSAETLEEVASRNDLFRITVVAPDGSRELFIAPAWRGRGAGPGAGWNPGAGSGGTVLIDRIVTRQEPEAVTEVHEGRRPGAARIAAGVRRANGGAILISVDATDVANLQRQSSLDALLTDIARSAADVAFIVYEDGDVRKVQGSLPDDLASGTRRHPAEPVQRVLTLEGRPVLEVSGPVDVGAAAPAMLHLGMRLDRAVAAERRTGLRLMLSLASASALGVMAIGLVWFRRRYGALSVEHARAREALRRRDRLAAMGELSSTVAHEIRNPLNAIAMSAQRLARECGGLATAGDAGELIAVIQQESQRINTKVQQFLDVARPPALNPQPAAVERWLAGAVAAVRPLAEARGLSVSIDSRAAGTVTFDADQMRQALDNLLRNAVDATPAGGSIAVRSALQGRDLVIEIRDSGAGIAADDLPRIFDLYFTTKTTGTGVGLAVTQQIVAAHGGTIEVESAPGRGTMMRVRLPAHGIGHG